TQRVAHIGMCARADTSPPSLSLSVPFSQHIFLSFLPSLFLSVPLCLSLLCCLFLSLPLSLSLPAVSPPLSLFFLTDSLPLPLSLSLSLSPQFPLSVLFTLVVAPLK